MPVPSILSQVVTEEAALVWWRIKYTGMAEPLIRSGRLNKQGTPLFDTNWTPAPALIALDYREQGLTCNRIATLLGKSHHAVADLFSRVDIMAQIKH
jgi:hypothetical protein